MKEITTDFINRSYEEIVDDILTSMLSGVANEPILYDVKTNGYKLSRPADSVRSITGKIVSPVDPAKEEFRSFINLTDYQFDVGRNEVVWQKDQMSPKDDTVFYVDYLLPPSERRSPLTDINVGSVTRTISEAIGREIATLYQQLNLVYLSAFVDTATGQSLDMVVAILDINRKTKDFAEGLITFFRNPTSSGDIDILEGTRVTTEKGDVIFETTQPRTLQRGQTRISVPIRAAEGFSGPVGQVPTNSITKMFRQLAGINNVTNFDATALGARDETDDELRIRAKAAVRALGSGTLLALRNAVAENRGEVVEIWDPNMPPARKTDPGQVVMLIDTEPERFATIRSRVEEVRAAGVFVDLQTRYIFLKPRIIVKIAKGITADGKRKIIQDIIAAIQAYVDSLTGGDPATSKDMLTALTKVRDVGKVTFVDVITSQTDTGLVESNPLVNAIMTAISDVSDPVEQQSKIAQVINETPPLLPSGRRKANRNLVQKEDSTERATDADIEAGKFKVVTNIDSNTWHISLDFTNSDIALDEGT